MRRAYPGCFLSVSVDVFGGQAFVFTLYCAIFLKKGEFSSNFSNMKAYVVVQGSVANIRNIVAMRSDQKLFPFTVANDLVRSDRLFSIISVLVEQGWRINCVIS